MASDQHPHSKIFGGNPQQAYPSFPKSDPIVVELPADDLIDAGNTRPLQVASIHAMSGPGRATPFTPPPPAPVYPEPVMIPSQTPPPVVGYGTMPSVAWQGQQPEPSGSYVHMAPPQQAYQQPAYPSVAPMSMDAQWQPQQAQQAQQQPPKKKSRAGLIVGIILGVGFFGLLAVGGGGFAYWKYYLEPAAEEAFTQAANQTITSNDTTTPAATTATPTATTATTLNTPAPTVKVNPLPVVTTKPASTSVSTSTSTSTSTRTASRATTTTTTSTSTAKVEPKADAKTETTKTDTAGEGGTGTVRSYTAEAGKPITIDGAMAGVAPAPLTVSCGSHQIAVGSAKAKTINVPCGGAVTVGSPDGT